MARRPHASHFRAHARKAVHLRAVLTKTESTWRADTKVKDLSLGGAGLALVERLTAGDRLVISFYAPSLWDPLTIPARVAWVGSSEPPAKAYRVGLAFEPKDPTTVFSLFELISTLPP